MAIARAPRLISGSRASLCRLWLVAAAWLASSALPAHAGTPAPAPSIEPVPHEKFTLSNGLTVIVNEDHSVPSVAVVVVYRTGSRDESDGQRGFAHLFEHLMFNGSEHYKGDYFVPMRAVGASSVGGSTSTDYTVYHQVVPSAALERALWLESDRMGYLLGAVDQTRLDGQRAVVKNEKRMADGSPLGTLEAHALPRFYPRGHPYSSPVLGSMSDLDAASLEQVRQWFNAGYGAANASLVLAGDVTLADAHALVDKYFGGLRAGPPVARLNAWVAGPASNIEDTVTDRVPQPVLERWWAIPGWGTREGALLDVVRQVLGEGKSSRLYRELVEKRRLASSVEVSARPRELMSVLKINLTLSKGTTRQQATAAIDEVVTAFLAAGPTARELQRIRSDIRFELARKRENLFERSSELVLGEVLARDPAIAARKANWAAEASPAEIAAVARQWLGRAYYQVLVVPEQTYPAATDPVDRSALPPVPAPTEPNLPEPHVLRLQNGIEVRVVRRRAAPIVQVAAQFGLGTRTDGPDRPGVAGFVVDMLDEGTSSRSAQQIFDAVAALGGTLKSGIDEDAAHVQLATVPANLAPAIDLLADVLRHPMFDAQQIERVRRERVATLAATKTDDFNALRYYMPLLVYGAAEPYGRHLMGLGTQETIQSVTREEILARYRQTVRSSDVTLFLVGDFADDQVLPLLNRAFGDWTVTGAATGKPPAAAATPAVGNGARVVLVDQPHATQSYIVVGRRLPAGVREQPAALYAFNEMMGGNFVSRLNLNLRQEKGWSYGSQSLVMHARDDAAWIAVAAVQTDKTGPSLTEMRKEFHDAWSTRQFTADDIRNPVNAWGAAMVDRLQQSENVLSDCMESSRLGRPDDYHEKFRTSLQALTPQQVTAVASQVLADDELVWLVIGDLGQIEKPIRALNMGKIEVWPSLDHGLH